MYRYVGATPVNQVYLTMAELTLDPKKRYTYADYLTWLDDTRRELIDGFFHLMTPAPNRSHQRVAADLYLQFGNYLAQKKCEAFFAPFDVRLPKNGETENGQLYTVVQPDICIICDLAKLDDKGCLGAPDLIVEILSPATSSLDTDTKFKLYEAHGVKEYWLVSPVYQLIDVFVLENGKYQFQGKYHRAATIQPSIFDDYHIDLSKVFT